MKTFIKVVEIWIPDKQRCQLEFSSGMYGALNDFKAASEQQHFAYNEGLPGKAWAAGYPIVLTRFEYSYFKRTEAAQKAGLTCGIALPIFSGDFLLAVVVFLCGDDEAHAGAIEVWGNSPTDQDSLRVMNGYYGTLDYFENISRLVSMSKGKGLPGMAWQTGLPVLIDNIGQVDEFIRAGDAQLAGITTGLAIPVCTNNGQSYVMTFLSAKATPLAKRIQLWMPDATGKQLLCQQGYSKHTNTLAEMFESFAVKKGVGALGRVWLSGVPILTTTPLAPEYNPELNSLSSMLAIPVIERGHLKAIVTFLF